MAGSNQNIRVTARTNMRDRAGRTSDEELLARVQAAADGAFGRSDTSKPARQPAESPVKRSGHAGSQRELDDTELEERDPTDTLR
jgi:hypothetical protein